MFDDFDDEEEEEYENEGEKDEVEGFEKDDGNDDGSRLGEEYELNDGDDDDEEDEDDDGEEDEEEYDGEKIVDFISEIRFLTLSKVSYLLKSNDGIEEGVGEWVGDERSPEEYDEEIDGKDVLEFKSGNTLENESSPDENGDDDE